MRRQNVISVRICMWTIFSYLGNQGKAIEITIVVTMKSIPINYGLRNCCFYIRNTRRAETNYCV